MKDSIRSGWRYCTKVKRNKQANRSYIEDQLMQDRGNKSNTNVFEEIFDEKLIRKVFHRVFLNRRLMDQNHDRQWYQHTNDTCHYLLAFLSLSRSQSEKQRSVSVTSKSRKSLKMINECFRVIKSRTNEVECHSAFFKRIIGHNEAKV